VTRLAQVVFAVLVAATLGAFFVTQRLKSSPRLVQTLSVSKLFSPNFPFRQAGIRIRLLRTDDVSVSLLDDNGDVVRHLVRGRHLPIGQPLQLLWNGRDDAGHEVPDGAYRIRVGLRDEGRSVTLIDQVVVDGTPPRPVVQVEGTKEGQGPLIFPLPGNRPVRFRVLNAPSNGAPAFRVFRTDLPRPRQVARLPAAADATTGEWRAPSTGPRRPPAGTYAIVAQVRDAAGNLGTSYPFGPRPRRNDPPARPGVTVRYLAGQGPLQPVRAGGVATVFVDARKTPYRWRLHRLGQARTLARGLANRPLLRIPVPRGPSGLLLLELHGSSRAATVPIPVTAPTHARVLLVLPLITWQGLNPVDDDGDGLPNTLDRGGSVRLARPFAGRGEPPGFGRHESPLLRLLDRPRVDYDLTTDYALALGGTRPLDRYSGVVLAGDTRWLDPGLGLRLRRYVEGGGKVFSLGTDSLRREVRVRDGRLEQPTGRSAFDVFGAQVDPIERRPIDLLAGDDAIGLFQGGDGAFSGFGASERTRDPGKGARVVSVAQDPAGRRVIVAGRLGKGLVIRTGLPEFEQRLGDANVAALTRRAWEILAAR
jgi:hypothetical protein